MSSQKLCVIVGLSCLGLPLALLTGCALETTAAPEPLPGVSIQGTVYGGSQPMIDAHIYLMAAGTGGYGTASQSLLQAAKTGLSDSIGAYVLTNSTGGFTVSSDYTCPASTDPVYLYALGGRPINVTTANPSAAFIYAFTSCSAAAGSTVTLNEVTTVASAYAMAGFATDATHVSSSNTALAQTGITNAFATANNIVNMSAGSVRTTTIGGNGTVPATTIGTLADILAACVNGTGTVSGPSSPTPCYTLFNNAKSGGTTGTTPSDTATAAINIAHNPASGVSALYGLQTGVGAPYTGLGAAPSDFTLQIAYTGGGLIASPTYDAPDALAVDTSGNVWLITENNSVLSEFNTLGVAANASGYTDLGLNIPASVTVDATSSNVWISNYGNSNVVKFNIASGTGSTYSTGGGSGPSDVAFDSSGNAIITDDTTSHLLKMTSTGGSLSTFATGNGLDNPFATAIGNNGYVWVANATTMPPNDAISLFSSTGTPLAASSAILQSVSVALGANNTAWFLQQQNPTIAKASYSGSTLTTSTLTATGGYNPVSLKIDGVGNLWFTSYDSPATTNSNHALNAIIEMTSTGTVLSGSAGFLSPTVVTPNSLAIDQSGNVWFNSETDAMLHELIGAAAPTAVPLASAQLTNLLGAKP